MLAYFVKQANHTPQVAAEFMYEAGRRVQVLTTLST